MWWQGDGVLSHNSAIMTQYLDDNVSTRWIDLRGLIHCPAYLTNLFPLDYFLREYLKDMVYNILPTNLNNFKIRILSIIYHIFF